MKAALAMIGGMARADSPWVTIESLSTSSETHGKPTVLGKVHVRLDDILILRKNHDGYSKDAAYYWASLRGAEKAILIPESDYSRLKQLLGILEDRPETQARFSAKQA